MIYKLGKVSVEEFWTSGIYHSLTKTWEWYNKAPMGSPPFGYTNWAQGQPTVKS